MIGKVEGAMDNRERQQRGKGWCRVDLLKAGKTVAAKEL